MLLQQLTEGSWLKARGKQRTDLTHILTAVRRRNQLELVHETLRHALNDLSVVAPDWLRQRVNAKWFEAYSQRTSNYLLPKKDADRQDWAQRVGENGLYLLREIYQSEGFIYLRNIPAVITLREVWIQHFYEDEDQVCLRGKKDQPPASKLISSTYDLDERCSTKRNTTWIGYKIHLTETCDDATPIIHAHLVANGYAPQQHFVDQGYMSINHVVSGQQDILT